MVIISVLVYKQRHENSNLKRTAAANYAHVRYIATRPRVLRNEGMEHGLFGKLQPGSICEFKEWEEIARRVYANSRSNITMYRSVVSFNAETAKELGLGNQKKWQRYIESQIMTIAEKNGIKREDFQWAGAVHDEKQHPHIHVVFWDTSVNAKNPFVPPAIPNAIRREMIKNTFAHKVLEFSQKKDCSIKDMRQITDDMVESFEAHLRRMRPRQFQQIMECLDTELDLMIPDVKLEQLGLRLLDLRKHMPGDGRIVYQLLAPEVKAKVDEMVRLAAYEFIPIRDARISYVEAKVQLAALYSSDETYLTAMKHKYENEADKIIANRILSGVRMVIRLESEMNSEIYIQNRIKFYMEQVLLESLEMLGQMTGKQTDMHQARHTLSGELSREAKKELYLKLQDKGYER